MKNEYYAKRTLLIILMSFFIGTMCTAQTDQLPSSKQYAISELGWTEQEYKDYLLNKDNKPNVAKATILGNMPNGTTIKHKEVEIPCKPVIWTMPLVPLNIINETDYENTTK